MLYAMCVILAHRARMPQQLTQGMAELRDEGCLHVKKLLFFSLLRNTQYNPELSSAKSQMLGYAVCVVTTPGDATSRFGRGVKLTYIPPAPIHQLHEH